MDVYGHQAHQLTRMHDDFERDLRIPDVEDENIVVVAGPAAVAELVVAELAFVVVAELAFAVANENTAVAGDERSSVWVPCELAVVSG